MFKFLGKNKQMAPVTVYAPITGNLIELAQVNDPVFSGKMMGDGFAIIPADSALYSPVHGIVSMIAVTKHAIGIQTDRGLDLLIHMGIDTVELAGSPLGFG
ncbi:PTS sugar transporter subunit IIA [Sporolactobacillus nakayamae]|uniref:PTS system, glucose subfamily, IIA component n=1 Tax=Sporolactobacillus nakayamae TaxID=269670 RepID=A0A1I2U8Y1_9BACL|nr:PTS glucose transporter subunit IIA [Sporolactobacillus nakayamae]SFG73624.1 PTS system, glucose subfamily, IIA component [Sporolactobacillus nakayamae]